MADFTPAARSELVVRLTTTTLSPQPINVISLTRISLFPASTTAHLLPSVDGSQPPPPRVDGLTSCSPESHPWSRHHALDLLRPTPRSPHAPPALPQAQQAPTSSRTQVTSYTPRRGAACYNPGSRRYWRWWSHELQPAAADARARCASGGVESTCYN